MKSLIMLRKATLRKTTLVWNSINFLKLCPNGTHDCTAKTLCDKHPENVTTADDSKVRVFKTDFKYAILND